MKKILSIAMLLLLSIAISGCAEKTEAEKAEEAVKEAAVKAEEAAEEAAKALKKAING